MARRWQYLAWTWQPGNERWGEITSEGHIYDNNVDDCQSAASPPPLNSLRSLQKIENTFKMPASIPGGNNRGKTQVACAQVGPCATPPNRTGGAIAPKLRARLYPEASPRRISFRDVLSSSWRTHMEVFGSAAATKCSRTRRWPLLRKTLEKAFSLKV